MNKITITAAVLTLAACSGPAAASHPASSRHPSPAVTQTLLICTGLNGSDGAVAQVVRDMRKQDHLSHDAGGLSPSVEWGAWISPGTYANDLSSALGDEENWADDHTPPNSHPGGTIDPNWPSDPPQLSADAGSFDNDGEVVNSNPSFSAPDWRSFRQDVAALRTDCGW